MERTNWVQDFEQHPGQWSLFCNWQGNSEHSNHIKQEIQIIINQISTSKLFRLEKVGWNYIIQYEKILHVHCWSQDAPESESFHQEDKPKHKC